MQKYEPGNLIERGSGNSYEKLELWVTRWVEQQVKKKLYREFLLIEFYLTALKEPVRLGMNYGRGKAGRQAGRQAGRRKEGRAGRWVKRKKMKKEIKRKLRPSCSEREGSYRATKVKSGSQWRSQVPFWGDFENSVKMKPKRCIWGLVKKEPQFPIDPDNSKRVTFFTYFNSYHNVLQV